MEKKKKNMDLLLFRGNYIMITLIDIKHFNIYISNTYTRTWDLIGAEAFEKLSSHN